MHNNEMAHQFDIRAERKRLGMTQQDLADLLEVALSTVWRWENTNAAVPKAVQLALQSLTSTMTQETANG